MMGIIRSHERPLYFRVAARKVVAAPDTFVPKSPTFLRTVGINLRNNTLVPFWQVVDPDRRRQRETSCVVHNSVGCAAEFYVGRADRLAFRSHSQWFAWQCPIGWRSEWQPATCIWLADVRDLAL